MPKKSKVLVIGRRVDLTNYAIGYANDLGFDSEGTASFENKDALGMIEKGTYVCCIIGNVFHNDKQFATELKEVTDALEAKNIPWRCPPTFGDAKHVLKDLGLWQEPTKQPLKQPPTTNTDAAQIAG